jgi:hypothetical protein
MVDDATDPPSTDTHPRASTCTLNTTCDRVRYLTSVSERKALRLSLSVIVRIGTKRQVQAGKRRTTHFNGESVSDVRGEREKESVRERGREQLRLTTEPDVTLSFIIFLHSPYFLTSASTWPSCMVQQLPNGFIAHH